MSYNSSECECDWCRKVISGDVACRACYEELETKVADLEAKVCDLEATIEASEGGL